MILGIDGRRHDVPAVLPIPEDVVGNPLAEPPADLSETRKAFWRAYAPHAIREGTLTQTKVLGFRELVALLDIAGALDARIQAEGAASMSAAEIRKEHIKYQPRLTDAMARYKLTASGRAEVTAAPKAKSNPWGAIATR